MLAGTSLSEETPAAPPGSTQQLTICLMLVAEQRCKQSFSTLFAHFAPRLRSYAMRFTSNEAQAMELVQETLTNVWQKAHLFNADKGAPSTWIFTIARNIYFDMQRKQQHRKEDIYAEDLWPVLCETQSDNSQPTLEQQVTLQQLGELMQNLPDKQKLVLEAIYLQGKSQQEVADQLSIPLGTVKSRTRLGLQRIKELIEQYD